MQDFRKLKIYQKSLEYCAFIYKFSVFLPSNEQYGLTTQLRRAATSIPLNISEGAGSASKKEFALFISYAYRSTNEVLTCLELINKLELSKGKSIIKDLENQGIELSRMIYRFFILIGGNTHT